MIEISRPRPIKADRHNGPWCQGKIHVAALPYTRVQVEAAQRRKFKGVPRDDCAMPAVFIWDDVPLCQRHAGDRALELIGAGDIKVRKRDVIDVRKR